MALIETRFIGENRYTEVNMFADLKSGQTVATVLWTIEAGSGITLVGGSNDVVNGAEGVASVVRGKFDYTVAIVGTWTLTAAATCATPIEVKIANVLVNVQAIPV